MEPILEHHYKNIKEGKTISENGNTQTVLTRQVNHPELNKGKPTLIPLIYHGEELSEKQAIQKAIESGIKWTSADSHETLRKYDQELHTQMVPELAKGTFSKGGIMDTEYDDKEVPFGSLKEEVADDIPVMLSEGEYVVPADVVRYWGLRHLEEMRMAAMCGLMYMEMDGWLHKVDQEGAVTEKEENLEEGVSEPVEEANAPMIEIVELDLEGMQRDASGGSNVIEVDFDDRKEGVEEEEEEEEDFLMMWDGGGVGGEADPAAPNDPSGSVSGVSDPEGISEDTLAEPRSVVGNLEDYSGPEGPTVNALAGNPSNIAGIGSVVSHNDRTLDVTGLTPEQVPMAHRALREDAPNPIGTARAATSMGFTGVDEFSSEEDIDKQVDMAVNARTAQDPTSAQLDMNSRLEKSFQAANPGITQAVNAAMTLAGKIHPGFSGLLAAGNILNAASGNPTVGTLSGMAGMLESIAGVNITEKVGEGLAALDISESIGEFADSLPGTISIAGTEPDDQDTSVEKIDSTARELAELQEIINSLVNMDGIEKNIPLKDIILASLIDNRNQLKEEAQQIV